MPRVNNKTDVPRFICNHDKVEEACDDSLFKWSRRKQKASGVSIDFKETNYSTPNKSKIVQNRAIVTMVDQWKVVYGLSNGAIFNDLERPLTQFSRLRHCLMLDISQTDKDTTIVTTKCE